MQRTANATNKHYSLNKNRIFSKPTVFSFVRANRYTQPPLSKYYLYRSYHLIKTQPKQRENALRAARGNLTANNSSRLV